MFPALSDVSSFRDNELRPHKNATVDVYKQIYQVAALVRKNVFAIWQYLNQSLHTLNNPIRLPIFPELDRNAVIRTSLLLLASPFDSILF